MIRCFDILIGLQFSFDPDYITSGSGEDSDPKSLDLVKIQIRPDPTVMDPVGPKIWDPVHP